MRTPRGRVFKRIGFSFAAPPWWSLVDEDRKNYRYRDSVQFVVSDCLHAALFCYGLPEVLKEQLDAELKREKATLPLYFQRFFLNLAATLPEPRRKEPLALQGEGTVRVQLALPEELYEAYEAWRKKHRVEGSSDALLRLIQPIMTFYDLPLFALERLRIDMAKKNLGTCIYSREAISRHLFEVSQRRAGSQQR